ncbi:MAG: hypothetical protein ACXWWC_10590 [Chitinophagaceae bacterium]
MEKYLFTDGTNGIREAQSKEELHSFIQSTGDPEKIRIWIFSTSEWISYSDFSKRSVAKIIPLKKMTVQEDKKKEQVVVRKLSSPNTRVVKYFIAVITAFTIFLVYNFTRVKWRTISPLQITAARPANTPLLNVDSLIQVIETTRGQKLDKVTLTNLRIRNSWPDRIELQLKTERDSGDAGTKFYHVELSVDNSTGYNIDNAVAELKEWKNNVATKTDTIHFSNIGYSSLFNRAVETIFRGDSLSVSFLSIKAKSFNFCYSSDKESNYGNFNDRWFCKD